MTDYYIMEDGGAVKVCTSLDYWANYFSKTSRHVADEFLNGARISTVFLGLDHRYTGDGPPILFETMIFTNRIGQMKFLNHNFMIRYCTYDEAEAGHKVVRELVKRKNLTALREF